MTKCFERKKFYCYIHRNRIIEEYLTEIKEYYEYKRLGFELIELNYDTVVLQNNYGEKYKIVRTKNCMQGCRTSVKDIEFIFGKPGIYSKC